MRVVKEAVATAREKERRKRLPGPLRVAGFCLPKALQPVLPIYLQGVLQVRPTPYTLQPVLPIYLQGVLQVRQPGFGLEGFEGVNIRAHGTPDHKAPE